MNRIIKKTIIVTVAISLIAGLFAGYFFFVRTPDQEYINITNYTTNMKNTQTNIERATKIATTAGTIIDIAPSLKEARELFNSSLASLNDSKIMSRDKNIYQIVSVNNPSFTQYSSEINTLFEPVDQYQNLLATCSELVTELESIKTATDYDTKSKACIDSVNKIDVSNSDSFTTQYLNEYIPESKKLIAAYKSLVVAGTDSSAKASAEKSIEIIQNTIVTLREKKIDIVPKQNVTNKIQMIEKVATERKAQLFR